MFLLSSLLVGVLAGFALRGDLRRLERLRVRYWPLVVAALALQLALFTILSVPGWLVPPLYVLSDLLALAWVGLNIRIAGMPLVGLGSLSNLVAILANGGRMPVDLALLARARGPAVARGVATGRDAANSVALNPHTKLALLTDRIPMPPPITWVGVYSVGDVLIWIGVAWLVAAAMRPVRM
jgi:hypothetical protein